MSVMVKGGMTRYVVCGRAEEVQQSDSPSMLSDPVVAIALAHGVMGEQEEVE